MFQPNSEDIQYKGCDKLVKTLRYDNTKQQWLKHAKYDCSINCYII